APVTPGAQNTRLRAATAQRIELAGPTPVALFQNLLPGPVLRVKRGMPLAVTVDNGLETPLSLNWQGVRVPNAQDGVPGLTGTAIAKGESRDISFSPPDAGTFLYRAFEPGLAHRALAGSLIVEETDTPEFAGDYVAMIQSWAPDPTMKVPLLTVNGAVSPTIEAPAGARVRLRLINASTQFLRARVVAAPSYVLAIDGQPVTTPFPLKDGRAQLTPGGRLDITVDVGTADPIVVEAETADLPIQLVLIVPMGAGTTTTGAAQEPPAPLPANSLPEKIPLEGAARFDVPLGSGTVSLASFPTLGRVKPGTTVVLSLINGSDAPVAVQLHGAPARILDGKDDGWKPWWHDAIPVPPRATVRAALVAQAVGKWAVIGLRGGDGAVVAARSYEVQ
ncbi:MAG: hypothetical protein B7Z45_04610, partial [Azorhizobium sp. 12-66-6]